MLSVSVPAWAAPVNDKREQAKLVKSKIDALDSQLEPATEDYDVAATRYREINAKVSKIRLRLSRIAAQSGVLQTSLNTRANTMYRSGPLGLLDVLLGAASFEDFATTWDFLNDQNKTEARSVAKLKQLRTEALATQAELVVTQNDARKVYTTMSSRKAFIETQLADRKKLLHGIESEIAALEAADQARRAADARRFTGGRSTGRGTGWDWGNPTRAPRSGVVGIAMKYLGRPYQWAATGPGSFDCSGFTMFVYAQVGVSLPHSSRSQIGSGQRVSRANLRPGDLVFFGSPIHHVGLYIGGGRMIHSPHTGDVVSIDSIDRGDYAGACRP